ncbi:MULTISPECIES: o-succinylbenzoate synthase [unclassified Staphylococcus]|uniref:o-succinylbenzoate synthase n=1 Tax=unclassified Staphylococcus TaxID=91994 RepID=UPI00203F7C0F|nr:MULTISPECIES: o-succinylbenzoate synthase [unclassified Staphylococcus]
MKIIDMKMYTFEAPFKQPIITPKVKLYSRKALVVELITDEGISYFGECNAFATNWYSNETIDIVKHNAHAWFKEYQGYAFETYQQLQATLSKLESFPATRSMIVMALYQIFYKLPSFSVPYGATVSGISKENIEQLKKTRPSRVKIKWSSQIMDDIQTIQNLSFKPTIAIDANESIKSSETDLLLKLAQYEILYVEEPFKQLATIDNFEKDQLPALAIDEKATSSEEIKRIVTQFNVKVVVLKPFRLGGIDRVLEIIKQLERANIDYVIGGMYEYGLSRYFTAMLARHASYPSDITPAGYYFETDYAPDSGILKGGSIEFEPPKIDVNKLTRID